MRIRVAFVAVILIVFSVSIVDAGRRARRGAGRGAAMGAVWGLILGGDIDDAVEGAVAGAAVGYVGGAVDDSYARKDHQQQQQQAQAHYQAQKNAQAAEQERQRLAAERRRLEDERMRLAAQNQAQAEQEAQPAAAAAARADPMTWTEEQWIYEIGVDNWNALVAFVDCQYQRSGLLAQAGATVSKPSYHLASKWIEALIAVDTKDAVRANVCFAELVAKDRDIDTVQQASLEIDKALLDLRSLRRAEGIVCSP